MEKRKDDPETADLSPFVYEQPEPRGTAAIWKHVHLQVIQFLTETWNVQTKPVLAKTLDVA